MTSSPVTSLKRLLDDVTKCPICLGKFNDPRLLPCIHTFCFQCIREWLNVSHFGDTSPCPLCRNAFAIPEGGLDNLPKNISVVKVATVKDLSTNKEVQSGTPTLVHAIPSSTNTVSVRSLAVRGNELFIARNGAAQIEVYDTSTFSLRRQLVITGLGTGVYGLVTCHVNDCLYVSDFTNSSVHKVDLSTFEVVLKWTVGLYPRGLSLNASRNVLVACYWSKSIQEYTAVGSLVREVFIRDGGPWHAIQLPSGQLVVSRDNPSSPVCVVGLDGQVIRSYGGRQLSNPYCMALFGKRGGVLVADWGCNNITALTSSLSDARHLPLSVEGQTQHPISLCLDESRGRLYVGENGGQGRVLVYDDVVNIDAMFQHCSL